MTRRPIISSRTSFIETSINRVISLRRLFSQPRFWISVYVLITGTFVFIWLSSEAIFVYQENELGTKLIPVEELTEYVQSRSSSLCVHEWAERTGKMHGAVVSAHDLQQVLLYSMVGICPPLVSF
jgi:hypothetical protein